MQDKQNSAAEQNTQGNGAEEPTQDNSAPTSVDPIQELEKKLREAEQKYIYLYAEFENYKKRAIKERQDTIKFGWENVATSLLEVLDNFNRALAFAKPDSDPGLLSGLKMVSQQFQSTLEKQGVAEIVTTNQAFNPELHEGVGQIPSSAAVGSIVQEVQKGYTLHGRLLRPSRVLVSSGEAAN